MPISRGGTGANSPQGASANILGTNFANYNCQASIEKGGLNAENDKIKAQDNLGLFRNYSYARSYSSTSVYIKIGTVKKFTSSNDGDIGNTGEDTSQTIFISGSTSFCCLGPELIIHISGNSNTKKAARQISLRSSNQMGYIDRTDVDTITKQEIEVRDFYLYIGNYHHTLNFQFSQSTIPNISFTKYDSATKPDGYTVLTSSDYLVSSTQIDPDIYETGV
ncbi:MAG: hypothetical protein LBT91_02810 [Bifidobacteriaceae bacterium]|nr:hypothetical protein [Bifidobacteriaceae bacterium]